MLEPFCVYVYVEKKNRGGIMMDLVDLKLLRNVTPKIDLLNGSVCNLERSLSSVIYIFLFSDI